MKYYVLLFILITSCQKDSLKFNDIGRKIVLNGLITTDTLFNVRIGKSAYINDLSGDAYESLLDIKGARVKVYQNDLYIDSLRYVYDDYYYVWNVFYPGNYWSKSIYPLPGKMYQIFVQVPGLPDVSASTLIPTLVRIDRIDTAHVVLHTGTYIESNVGIICNIEFTDPGDESNYYLFNITKIPSFGINYNNISFECHDPIVEETLKRDELKGIAFTDKIIQGQKYRLTVLITGDKIEKPFTEYGRKSNTYRKTIYFRLYSITEEYFRYIQTLALYNKNYGNPLSEPVLMYSNVKGGFGMFSGAAVSVDSIVFTK